MEQILILKYPKRDLEEVCRLVRVNDSFAALITGDMYQIHQYLLATGLRNVTAIFDRNVYTRVTSLIRAEPVKASAINDHRWAAAIMAFCQIADIKLDYASSLQEYAFQKGGEAALSDYEDFRKADNCDPQSFIDYAVGRTDTLDLTSVKNLPPARSDLTPEQFEARIYEFRLNYILALKIVLLSQDSPRPETAMCQFMDWMEKDFIMSAPAFQFANLLFSPSRIKGMLKSKTLPDVRNIAWDLALVQYWRRLAWKGSQADEPVLLVSRDKVVKFIARRLMASDEEKFHSFIIEPWQSTKGRGAVILEKFLDLQKKVESRKNDKKRQTDNELDALTTDLENALNAYHFNHAS